MRYLVTEGWAIETDAIVSLARRRHTIYNGRDHVLDQDHPVEPRVWITGGEEIGPNYLTEAEWERLWVIFMTGQPPPAEWGKKDSGPTQAVKAVLQDEHGILWTTGNEHWICHEEKWYCVPPTCKTPQEAIEWAQRPK